MYKDIKEARELVIAIKRDVFEIDNVEMVVIPPFVDLAEVDEIVTGSNLSLGAQNCYWEKEGAFTGEISPAMLKSVGCKYVVVGHSERRKYFGETDETVNLKIKAVIEAGLSPIACVGETLEEREKGETLEVVKRQVKGALKGFSADFLKKLVIAYEPVWAIGTGRTATPDQAQEVHAMIRGLLRELYSVNFAEEKCVLYGGSVKPDNIESLMRAKDIDGGLIGGASLKADGYVSMAKITSALYASL
jgi:triosephosphate isomerase